MKISELSAATGVSVPTLKYYLREGLVPAGASRGATRAEYDDTHVARVRLVRALVDRGGLSIARVRAVVDALENPPTSWHDLLGVAQASVIPVQPDDVAGPAGPPGEDRATRLLDHLRWQVAPGCPAVVQLRRALADAEGAGVLADPSVLQAYAAAARQVAELDVASVPEEAQAAMRQVVLGTVLLEPVLRALRLLAQQDVSARRFAGRRSG